MTISPSKLKSALEAIIYAADEPATVEQLASVLGEEKPAVRAALDELVAAYSIDERGIEIRAVAGGYRFYTKPQHHDVVRRFIKSLRPPLRLTMPALETLAVIAYKQPVTQPELQEIRGVNCAGVIETLLERRLVTTAGRKQVIGRPILYRTSKEFLLRFGLGDLEELPSLKEFEALAREAMGSDDGVANDANAEDASDVMEGEILEDTDGALAPAEQVPEQGTDAPQSLASQSQSQSDSAAVPPAPDAGVISDAAAISDAGSDAPIALATAAGSSLSDAAHDATPDSAHASADLSAPPPVPPSAVES